MTTEASAPTLADTPTAAWGAVLSMASEFLPVSLLTPMAAGLHATEGQTGQAISISGLFAVVASLLVTTVAGRLNRKTVLVAMTALMLASLVLVAAASNFTILMVGRALLGVCVGGFWALATAVIMRLVPSEAMPRALAVNCTAGRRSPPPSPRRSAAIWAECSAGARCSGA
jgi:predicted MFS family arabinose efflux permease